MPPSALFMDDRRQDIAHEIGQLRKRGWAITYARTPRKALDALFDPDRSFDAAVLDWQMKDEYYSGLTVLREIRKRAELDNVCVVILTGEATMPEALQCMREGAFDCVAKTSSDARNLERILLAGITLERAHSLRRSLVSQPDLDTASESVRTIIKSALRDVEVHIEFFSGNGPRSDLLRRERPLVAEALRTKRAVLEVDPERVSRFQPINPAAREILSAPIGGPRKTVVGLIHIESLKYSVLDTNWKRVVDYLADLLGFAHEAQSALNVERHRVEELETTASEFAHRIATPLQPITLQVQQLMDVDLPQLRATGSIDKFAEITEERLEIIARNARDIRDVTNHLRAITKPWHPQKRVFQLNRLLLRHAAELRDELAEKSIDLVARLDPPGGASELFGDEEQIGYCIQCLLRNAIEAIEEKRRGIADPAYDSSTNGDVIELQAAVQQSGECTVSVSDSGTGVTPTVREHLFKPLFSTKRRIDPSGMGLFSVRRIIMLHGGDLECESPTRGAKFTLRFPPLAR